MSVRQAPGWWPNLLQFVCDRCGYVGPTRDAYNGHSLTWLRVDEREHNEECS